MTTLPWSLECSACGATRSADGLPGVCDCGQPYLVRYRAAPAPEARALLPARRWTMWRYREWLPLADSEAPITLGEGGTPLLTVPRLAAKHGFRALLVKEEGANPTGSFKARGLAAAVTRAALAGAKRLVVPTAGNAGVALAAYAARAGLPARVYAPATTPPAILGQIRSFGGDLVLVHGHIGDCGKAARAYAAETGAVDVSTLREPYRIEGKKTLGLELAEQLEWTLPDAIVYPTGGGTGLIGMWKAFGELMRAGREKLRGRDRVLRALARPAYRSRGAAGSRATRGPPDASSTARDRRWGGGSHGQTARDGGQRPADARGHRRVPGGRGFARRSRGAQGARSVSP